MNENSLLQPRGDIYESGITPTRRRTRLNERCRQNYRNGHLRDSSFSHARHQSVHTSRHRIGAALAPVCLPCPTLLIHWAKKTCATLLGFYVLIGEDCTMQCIQGKSPLKQLEKNPRFQIAYRQLGVECHIQQETVGTVHVSDTLTVKSLL